ncbi:MAG: P27 family phage terminase small subunit [Pseudooceanicola sp.]|nr:P27 family phage terminase small subunit [Pseudooceanicola sp.]
MGRAPKIDGRKSQEGGRGIVLPVLTADQIEEPADLSIDAAFAWQQAVASLVPGRALARADVLALEAACRAWGRWREIERQIGELGRKSGNLLAGEVSKTPNGHVQMSALRIAAKQALGEFTNLAKEFGMTPVSRVRTAGSAQGSLFDLPDVGS